MNQRIQIFVSTKWPTIIWSAIIFILLAMPGRGLPSEDLFSIPHFDKLIHATLFFVLVWLWLQYIQQGKKVATIIMLFAATIATFYGVIMEFVQIYTGRDFSVGDMLADGFGAFLGVLVARKK